MGMLINYECCPDERWVEVRFHVELSIKIGARSISEHQHYNKTHLWHYKLALLTLCGVKLLLLTLLIFYAVMLN